MGKLMDERIEAFLKDVLALEGEIWNLLRQGVSRHLAICEKQFRDAETNKRMKDRAAQACRTLCRARVAEEIRRRKGTSTAEHLKVVLSIIDTAAPFPSND
jgi:anti-sigma factor RsiW